MPLFAESDGYRLAECLRHLRQQPFLAYGIALAAFALATLGRWAIEGYVPGRIPFIFYFPAVVIASLFGGIGPGVFVAILSGITAWLAFMPVHQALGEKFAVLFAFGAASLLLVALVAALIGLSIRFSSRLNSGATVIWRKCDWRLSSSRQKMR
jgi:Domain of unknown function (DUF4118)